MKDERKLLQQLVSKILEGADANRSECDKLLSEIIKLKNDKRLDMELAKLDETK